MPIVVVATMTAKPESVDTVRDACKQAIEAVHQEPGCELYALHEADGTFVFVEQSADADALTAHADTPAVATLFGTVGEHLDGAPDIKMLQPVVAGDSAKGAAASRNVLALDGKVAFITGATNGQGRAEAVRLASDGASIIAVDICDQIASVPYPLATPDDLALTVKLVEDTGARIVAQQADVRDPMSLKNALAAGIDELGRLDIVVANAGIAPMHMWPDRMAGASIDVNLAAGVSHRRSGDPDAHRTGRRRGDRAHQFGGGPDRRRQRRRGRHRVRRGQARYRRTGPPLRQSACPAQHSGELGASGRGGHADDQQRGHPSVVGQHRRQDSPGDGQRVAGSGAATRGHRQRGGLAGLR